MAKETESPKDPFDWAGIKAEPAERLQVQEVKPVPEHIIKLAQRAYDGVPHPTDSSKVVHTMQYEFPSEEVAAAFVSHMKNAGLHTVPVSSASARQDPDRTGNKKLVAWRVGERKGRKTAE